jgi:hypothetical protein
MLSQVNIQDDTTLAAKITQAIGRKSNIPAMAQLEMAQCEREEFRNQAHKKLEEPLKKLLPPQYRLKDDAALASKVDELGGWDKFEKWVLEQIPKKSHRPGSKVDTCIKNLRNYIKDLASKDLGVDKLLSVNQKEKLDPAQAEAIRLIRSGESVVILGPPGSGKTHCALFDLETFASNTSSTETVIYIAPTSELVLQSYANLSVTFPNARVGIICPLTTKVNGRPNILVGTPQEVWTYLAQSQIKFSRIIIDEAHTIVDTEMGYSDSLVYLLQRVNKEPNKRVVALSATIHVDDVPILVDYLAVNSGIPADSIRTVTLDPSPVPVETFHVRAEKVTPKMMFEILKNRLDKNGCLIFTYYDKETWTMFLELFEWMEQKNEEYYGLLLRPCNKLNAIISEAAMCRGERMRLSNIKKATSTVQREMTKLEQKEIDCNLAAMAILVEVLNKALTEFHKLGELPEFYETASPRDARIAAAAGVDGVIEGQPVPLVAKHILRDILPYAYAESGSLPYISEVGPYFSLLGSNQRVADKEFEALSKMSVSEDSQGREVVRIDEEEGQDGWAAVSSLVRLAKAEGVRVADIKPTITIMCRAFRYGIGMMAPSLPFVITQTIRKMLSEKGADKIAKLPFVFATSELAVGISYPLRNVVIVGHKDMKPSLQMQMRGRCGRRSLDTQGVVCLINCDEVQEIERLNVVSPLYNIDTINAICSTLVDADSVMESLSPDEEEEEDVTKSIHTIVSSVRSTYMGTDNVDLVTRLVYSCDSMSGFRLKEEDTQVVCTALFTIRHLIAASRQLHWRAVCTKQMTLAAHLMQLDKSLRKASLCATRYCF